MGSSQAHPTDWWTSDQILSAQMTAVDRKHNPRSVAVKEICEKIVKNCEKLFHHCEKKDKKTKIERHILRWYWYGHAIVSYNHDIPFYQKIAQPQQWLPQSSWVSFSRAVGLSAPAEKPWAWRIRHVCRRLHGHSYKSANRDDVLLHMREKQIYHINTWKKHSLDWVHIVLWGNHDQDSFFGLSFLENLITITMIGH